MIDFIFSFAWFYVRAWKREENVVLFVNNVIFFVVVVVVHWCSLHPAIGTL